MNQKKPNPIDVHVGSRIRLRRMMLEISQEKLGDALGITFQQVQKYEKGSNRVGASRLQEIARALDINVGFFFEDAPDSNGNALNNGMAEEKSGTYVVDFISSSEGLQLVRAFLSIPDRKQRRALIDLMRTIADGHKQQGLPASQSINTVGRDRTSNNKSG